MSSRGQHRREQKRPTGTRCLNTVAHPLGIRPRGNLFSASSSCIAAATRSLGAFAALAHVDEAMLAVLGAMSARELSALSGCSRALYCWSTWDELWKRLVLGEMNGRFRWCGTTWRETYAGNSRRDASEALQVHDGATLDIASEVGELSFDTSATVFSDTLHQSHVCATVDIRAQDAWLERDNIDRRSADTLSVDAFRAEYERPNRPVCIRGVVDKWRASESWTREQLVADYGDVIFRAEAMDIPLRDYFLYAESVREESPLYLFDKCFAETTQMARDYEVPAYFRDDLFQLLGDEARPDYRWVIVGPERSGSSFHKDPNATSAWNATITGSKKWILLPPDVTPPGVFASHDGSEVATPASLIEWFIHYYHELANLPTPAIECITRPGDLIFVPTGWWHLVINLEPHTIAVTQNFVSRTNLATVMRFLRNNPEQVSGVPCTEAATLAARFEKVLREREPELWDECEKELARSSRKRAHDGGDSAADGVRSVKFWDSVRTEEVNAEDEPFAFDFGDNVDDVSDAAEAAVPLR